MDISKTELEVLQALWLVEPASADKIVDKLNQSKPWHEKTVKTLLNRLVKKHAIGFNKVGRSYEYYTLIEQQAFQASETRNFVQHMFSGKISPLVVGFAQNQPLSRDDVEELKKFIESWEDNNN